MCWSVIVDANCFGELKKPAGKVLLGWLGRRHGKLSYPAGGQGAKELRDSAAAGLFEQLRLAGHAARRGKEALKKREAELDVRKMKSNDPHMLALARVSEARLLVSKDQKLRLDFRGDLLPDLTPQGHEKFPVHREIFPIEDGADVQRQFLDERRCALLGAGVSPGR